MSCRLGRERFPSEALVRGPATGDPQWAMTADHAEGLCRHEHIGTGAGELHLPVSPFTAFERTMIAARPAPNRQSNGATGTAILPSSRVMVSIRSGPRH